MIRTSIQSKNIKAVGYDLDTHILEVEFVKGGIYQYKDVPEDVYNNLMTTESAGKFFYKNIRSVFECEKVKDTKKM